MEVESKVSHMEDLSRECQHILGKVRLVRQDHRKERYVKMSVSFVVCTHQELTV